MPEINPHYQVSAPAKKRKGPSAVGTAVSGSVGAAAGYGIHKFNSIGENIIKNNLKDKDAFIKKAVDEASEYCKKMGSELTEGIKKQTVENATNALKSFEETLKKIQKTRVKWVAGFAAGAVALYVGIKCLLKKKD